MRREQAASPKSAWAGRSVGRRRWWCACVCLVVLESQAAQAPAPGSVGPDEIRVAWTPYVPRPVDRSTATFTVETRVVEINAVVRDRQGHPVPDLNKDDFEVFDAGKKREVSHFSVLRSTSAGRGSASAGATAPPRFIGLVFNDVMLELCSNAPTPPGAYFASLKLGASAAQRFLTEGLGPRDRVSLFTLSEGQVVPFTKDIPALIRALKAMYLHRGCIGVANPFGVFSDIVSYVAKMPGERIVLLAARNVNVNRLTQHEIVHRAVDAGVAVNVLDTRGLDPGNPTLDLTAVYLTQSTGGTYFRYNNDFVRGFKELGLAPEVSYAMSFVSDADLNYRYRPLKVQVKRPGRYSIQARPGYYADPPPKARPSPEEAKLIELTLGAGMLDEAPVSFAQLPDRLVNGAPAVNAVAHVDLARLPFRTEKDRRVERITVVAALLDERSEYVTGKRGVMELALTESSYDQLSKQGINATFVLEGPPGKYRLRIVAREEATGKISTADFPIELR